MFKMFAIICAVTVYECNTMYEDPPRTFATKEECLAAAVIKEKHTKTNVDVMFKCTEYQYRSFIKKNKNP